jgi:hypothetical protein
VRRLPHHQVHDVGALHAVLAAGRVAHVAVVDDGQPYVLPLAYARVGDRVVVHGSSGSRAFRMLAAGRPTCLTVTVVDGLVVARAAFETSMRYRCAMVLGSFEQVLDGEDKLRALEAVSDHSLPGRWADVRPPTRKQLAATSVLALPLDEWSVKVSAGWPEDEPADLDLPAWAGVLPYETAVGTALAAPDLRGDVPPPPYLATAPAPGTSA